MEALSSSRTLLICRTSALERGTRAARVPDAGAPPSPPPVPLSCLAPVPVLSLSCPVSLLSPTTVTDACGSRLHGLHLLRLRRGLGLSRLGQESNEARLAATIDFRVRGAASCGGDAVGGLLGRLPPLLLSAVVGGWWLGGCRVRVETSARSTRLSCVRPQWLTRRRCFSNTSAPG